MSKATILIIEDERALVEVLSYNLRKEGVEVHSATDGQDGLLRAQRTLS
jgi:DNA-binding response OmpR family regulator